MEAVADMPTQAPTEVEQVMEATSFGINKTNTTQARHHFAMAQQSIDRALGFLEGMTRGKQGTFATTLLRAEERAYTARTAISDGSDVVEGVQTELAELWA